MIFSTGAVERTVGRPLRWEVRSLVFTGTWDEKTKQVVDLGYIYSLIKYKR